MKKVKILLSLLLCLCASSSLFAQYNVFWVADAMKFPKRDLSVVCAHRGYWMERGVPENSLKAIHRAADFGIESVELDVKMSRDGVPVILHDYHIRRTTEYNGDNQVNQWNNVDLKKLRLVDKYGTLTNERLPNLQDVLSYIYSQKLSIVVVLDIKDRAAARACWEVVKRNKNAWNTPAFEWVVFKLSADMYADPGTLENDLKLKTVHFYNGLWRAYEPYFKFMQVFTTSMAYQFNCLARYNGFKNEPYFLAVEVNAKQTNGNLWPLVDEGHRNGKTVGCFNPVPDAPNGRYWKDGGWETYALKDVFSRGDTDDRRWNWSWLIGWCGFYTSDDPVGLAQFLSRGGKRNTNWYKNGRGRVGEEEIATQTAFSVYPNPTVGKLSVNLTQDITGPVQFNVVDLTGKPVFSQQQKVEEGQQAVVLPDLKDQGLKPGVYFLQVTPADASKRKTVKVVLE